MTDLLIIGYGNPLRGDDAVGYLVAQSIPSALAVSQLSPELADPISRARRVIFVDARESGEPGAIEHRVLDPNTAAGNFTHHLTPEALLATSAALYGRAPEAEIYTIAAQSFDFGAPLSAPVQRALDVLLCRLAAV